MQITKGYLKRKRNVSIKFVIVSHLVWWQVGRCGDLLFPYPHFPSHHVSWQIPSTPVSEDDYSLSRSRTSPLSPRSSEQYHSLMALLRKQHEVRTHRSPHFFSLNESAVSKSCCWSVSVLSSIGLRSFLNKHSSNHSCCSCPCHAFVTVSPSTEMSELHSTVRSHGQCRWSSEVRKSFPYMSA